MTRKLLTPRVAAGVALLIALGSSPAHAQQPGDAAAAQPADAGPKIAESALLPGKFLSEFEALPFGGDVAALIAYERGRIGSLYRARIRGTPDVRKRDRLEAEAEERVVAFSKTHVEFSGQATGFDVSVLSGEFRHRAGHALRTREDGGTRFYFLLSGGKLWKLVCQKPAKGEFSEMFGKLRAIYGEPAKIETRTVYREGDAVDLPHRISWTDGLVSVVLTDMSAVYNSHVVKWALVSEEQRLSELAETRPADPRKRFGASRELMDVMKKDEEDPSLDDIVDQLLEGHGVETGSKKRPQK